MAKRKKGRKKKQRITEELKFYGKKAKSKNSRYGIYYYRKEPGKKPVMWKYNETHPIEAYRGFYRFTTKKGKKAGGLRAYLSHRATLQKEPTNKKSKKYFKQRMIRIRKYPKITMVFLPGTKTTTPIKIQELYNQSKLKEIYEFLFKPLLNPNAKFKGNQDDLIEALATSQEKFKHRFSYDTTVICQYKGKEDATRGKLGKIEIKDSGITLLDYREKYNKEFTDGREIASNELEQIAEEIGWRRRAEKEKKDFHGLANVKETFVSIRFTVGE